MKRIKAGILMALSFSLIPLHMSVSEPLEAPFTYEEAAIYTTYMSKEALIRQPNGPFAVMVFQDSALGVNIGVIRIYMHNPVDERWGLTKNRFWQENLWASAVTSFAWSPDGKYLFVGTNYIYGDGGLFQLNLREKKAKRVLPEGETDGITVFSTEITGIDKQKDHLIVKVEDRDEKITTVTIPFE